MKIALSITVLVCMVMSVRAQVPVPARATKAADTPVVRDNRGAAKWSVFPYNGVIDQCNVSIPGSVYHSAGDLIGYVFYRIDPSVETIKYYISTYNPVIIGIYTSQGMLDEGRQYAASNSKSRFLWAPGKNDISDYHAMVCVGFDDVNKQFILLNSWGSNWGEAGFCYIPYSVFYERAREFYIAKPENRNFVTTGNKVKQILGTFKGEISAFDYRDDVRRTNELFKEDLEMLKAKTNRTATQDQLLKQLKDRVNLK